MNFFIKLIKKLFNKNKIKYISAPSKTEEESTNISIQKENNDNFRINLIYQANPEISDGNGHIIQKINIKDMV